MQGKLRGKHECGDDAAQYPGPAQRRPARHVLGERRQRQHPYGQLQRGDGFQHAARGAGIVGKKLSKLLLAQGAPVTAFIDIDPAKVGRTRRGLPVIAPQACLDLWQRSPDPILLAAAGARGARPLVREQINGLGLVEGRDWWAVA